MEEKEAIERIKARFDKWALDDEDMKAIQTLIPELKESEDERIIKTLQEYVKNRNWPLNGPTQDEVLAWLEKQKEPHKRLRDKTPWIVTAKEELAHDEERLQANLEELHRIRAEKEKQKEQEPEWSEEDKVMLNNIIWGVHMKSIKPLDEMDDRSKYERYEDFLKALPERFNLQPRTEWSEEDEQTFIKSVETLEYLGKFELADWLKEHKNQFLKPQNTWKPSEEQIKALDKAIPVCMGVVGRDEITPLESLLQDLKKLM